MQVCSLHQQTSTEPFTSAGAVYQCVTFSGRPYSSWPATAGNVVATLVSLALSEPAPADACRADAGGIAGLAAGNLRLQGGVASRRQHPACHTRGALISNITQLKRIRLVLKKFWRHMLMEQLQRRYRQIRLMAAISAKHYHEPVRLQTIT